MKIIVGLGNPGEKYIKTRHNAGFLVINQLAKQTNQDWEYNKKFNAEIIKDGETIYIKPLTFMNNSGNAVSAVMSYYKLLPKKMGIIREKDSDLSETLTVIHDDLDLPLGTQKISLDSRAGGHNGVQSIIDHLKTKNFKRIRIGINSERPPQMSGKDFVLGIFNDSDINKINALVKNLKV